MYQTHEPKQPKTFFRKRTFVVVGLILIGLVAIATALEMTGITDFVNLRRAKHYVTTPSRPNRTINEQTKGETGQNSDQNHGSQQQSSNDKGDTGSNSSDLLTPTGPFVSNHHPNLSGSPAPSELQSACTTTPGAKCQIIFRNGPVTKYLPAQQTDSGGSAYWSWKLQDIGLTAGTWQITAQAVLNNQTRTAADSLNLEVEQ